jgi:hypothetical protein
MINDNNSNLINFHKIPNSNRPEINQEVFNSLLQSIFSDTNYNHDIKQQPSYLKNEYKINYKYGLKYHQDSPSDIEFIQFLEQQLEYLKWARHLLHVQGQGGSYAGLPLELRVTVLDNVASSCHLLSPSIRKAIVNYALDKATLPKAGQTDFKCKKAFFKAVNNKKIESSETNNILKLAST